MKKITLLVLCIAAAFPALAFQRVVLGELTTSTS